MRADKVLILRQVLDANEGIDAVARLEVEEVLQGTALGILRPLGDLVDFEPVAAPHLREEQHRGVHRGRVDVLDEVLVARVAALGTDTAARLRAEFAQRRTLDIAVVRDGDDHLVIGVEVLGIEFLGCVDDLAATLVGVLLLDLQQLLTDEGGAQLLVGQEGLEVRDLLDQGLVLGTQLVTLESCEGTQTHIYDSSSLDER